MISDNMDNAQDDDALIGLGQRIRRVRRMLSLTQDQLADALNVHKNTLNRYERGERMPDAAFLIGVCTRWKEINPVWLLTGEGVERLERVAENWAGYKVPSGPAGDLLRPGRGEVHTASGAVVRSDQVADDLAFAIAWLEDELGVDPARLALVRAEGDCMTETIRDGDLLLVDLGAHDVKSDAIYVLAQQDALTVKRLQRLHDGSVRVSCDNKAYQEEVVSREEAVSLDVVGRVVWAGSRL